MKYRSDIVGNTFYSIYDLDGNLVKNHLRRSDVLEFCNLTKDTVLSTYCNKDIKLNGEYILKIEKSLDGVLSTQDKFTRKMYDEWTYMNKKYGTRWKNKEENNV